MILYQHLKPNGEIFYIGIGKCEKRAYNKFNRNKYWKNIVNKYGYNVEILYDNLTIKEAKQLEIYLIKYYGRKDLKTGNLVNMTSGGEGTYGRITSKESNIKRSNSMKGRIFSKEHRLKLSLSNKGKTVSEETKLKMKKSRKNISEETRLKMSLFQRNRIYTEKDKKFLSDQTKRLFSKKIINILTGEIFDSILLTALSINMKRTTLNSQLLGVNKNKTNFKYLKNECNNK